VERIHMPARKEKRRIGSLACTENSEPNFLNGVESGRSLKPPEKVQTPDNCAVISAPEQPDIGSVTPKQ
jgi:hypothetical protein